MNWITHTHIRHPLSCKVIGKNNKFALTQGKNLCLLFAVYLGIHSLLYTGLFSHRAPHHACPPPLRLVHESNLISDAATIQWPSVAPDLWASTVVEEPGAMVSFFLCFLSRIRWWFDDVMLPLRMFSSCSGNRCYASADSWHSRGVHTAGMAHIHKPGWKFIGTSLNLPNETDNIGHRIFLHHCILLSFRTPKTTIHTQMRTPE